MRRVGVLLLLLVLAGCTGTPTPSAESGVGTSVAVGVDPGSCLPPPAHQGDLPASFPRGLELPEGATVTDIVEVGAGVIVDGYVERRVPAVITEVRDLLDAGGFAIDSEDDEGREAELYFSDADRQGQYVVSATRCPRGATGFRVISGFQVEVPAGSGGGAGLVGSDTEPPTP